MTIHLKSAMTAVLAALLSGPALARAAPDPAPPAAPAVKIDLPPVAVPPTGQWHPGKVIWFDLLTLDPASAIPFYEAVLGWTTTDRGGYAIARDADVPVAGILRMPAPKAGAPAQQSRWVPLISVPDVARAAAAAQKAGGRVLEGPGSLGRRGTYAAVADPRGAQFVLVTAAGGDPLDADAPPPGWMWAELWTDDLKGSATFYKAVVGYDAWQVGAGKQATWILASGGRPRARAARMPFQNVPAQWLPYVVVKDLKGALGRVTEMNGHVLRKPGAKGPQFAVVSDPGGATFILEQRPEQSAEEVAQSPGSAVTSATSAVAAATAGTGTPQAPPPPPPPPDADPFGLDAAQQKAQQDAAAQAAVAQPGDVAVLPGGDVGTAVVVAAPAPFVNVWIAPPAWGSWWGPGWGMPPGWIGAPWWGMPPMWGMPPVWGPGGGGFYPGYRPPPAPYRPGTGPRPPVPAPRGASGVPGVRPAPSYRPTPAPSFRSAPAPAPAPRPAAPSPRR